MCAPGKKVSDILLEYYGAPGTASATGVAARSRKARALYVGASSEIALWALTWSVGAKLGLMDGVRDSPFRRTLLEKFLAALKTKVAEEAARAAPTPAGMP